MIYQIRLIWIDLVARLNAAPFASGAGLVPAGFGAFGRVDNFVAMNDRTTAGSGGSLEDSTGDQPSAEQAEDQPTDEELWMAVMKYCVGC